MSTQPIDKNSILPEREFRLVPTYLDLACYKTQLALGMLMAAAIIIVIFGASTQIGFVSSDYRIVRAAAASSNGDIKALAEFLGTSAQAHDCGLLAMINFSIDWLIWRAHSVWYHIENLLLFAFCAFFVAQITAQLADLQKNRLGGIAGVWAAILFVLYPAHADSVSWISARSHLLVMLFYLASVFYYFRFRMLRERRWLPISIASAIAAYLSEPVSWSLPLLITLAEFGFTGPSLMKNTDTSLQPVKATESQLQKPVATSNLSTMRFSLVIFHWAAFFFIGTVGLVAPGSIQLVGALRDRALPLAGLSSPSSTLFGLIAPIGSSVYHTIGAHTAEGMRIALLCAAFLAVLMAALRIVLRQSHSMIYAWLLLWLGLSIVPQTSAHFAQQTFLSSNLYYMASAPLCILLGLSCIPAGTLSKKTASIYLLGGCVILLVIASLWTWLALANEKPWLKAGQTMQSIH